MLAFVFTVCTILLEEMMRFWGGDSQLRMQVRT